MILKRENSRYVKFLVYCCRPDILFLLEIHFRQALLQDMAFLNKNILSACFVDRRMEGEKTH